MQQYVLFCYLAAILTSFSETFEAEHMTDVIMLFSCDVCIVIKWCEIDVRSQLITNGNSEMCPHTLCANKGINLYLSSYSAWIFVFDN